MSIFDEVKFVVPAPPGAVVVECRNPNRDWYYTPLVAVAYDNDMHQLGHITFQDGGIGFYHGAHGMMFFVNEDEIVIDESDIDLMFFWHKARATVCKIAEACSATICDVQAWISEDDELPSDKYTNKDNVDSLAKEFLAWNAATDQDTSKFEAVLNALSATSPDTETVL